MPLRRMLLSLVLSLSLGRVAGAEPVELADILSGSLTVAEAMSAPVEGLKLAIDGTFGVEVAIGGPRLLPFGNLEAPHFRDDPSYLNFMQAPNPTSFSLVRCERLDPGREFWAIWVEFSDIPEGTRTVLRCNIVVERAPSDDPLGEIAAAFDQALPGVRQNLAEDRIGFGLSSVVVGADIEIVSLGARYLDLDFGPFWAVSFVAVHVPKTG